MARGKGNLFTTVKLNKPRYSTHDLSYDNKLTTDFGTLTPVFAEEVVPGDKFRVSSEFFVRFMPMIAPIMHRVNVHIHYFYVPYRLCWKPFNDWIKDYSNAQAPVIQRIHVKACVDNYPTLIGQNTLWDYLGLPNVDTSKNYQGNTILPFWFTAYQLIYNEYYRDQNLEDEIELPTEDNGVISTGMLANLLPLRKRAWEKDYFTSALPWPQRGADVHLPLSGDAPVSGLADITQSGTLGEMRAVSASGVAPVQGNSVLYLGSNVASDEYDVRVHTDGSTSSKVQAVLHDAIVTPNSEAGYQVPPLHADMSQVTAATINDLRKANALQRWFEMSARAGNRVKEFFLSNFGTAPQDLRIDRPEYLGGGKQAVVIQDIDQTSSSDEVSPQANLSGKAGASGNTPSFTKSFTEHGVVMGIMSITPRSAYMDGLPRHFTKFDQLDHYFPIFQHLGEQEIKNEELFFGNDLTTNKGTFGYTPRYAEYKYHSSEIHGDFRGNLKFWHLGRSFAALPPLHKSFVQVDVTEDDLNRIFADTSVSSQKLIAEVFNNVRAIRPMDYYSLPSLL